MIEINLLPGAGKRKSSRQGLDLNALAASLSGRIKDKFVLAAVVTPIVAVLAVGYMYWSQSRESDQLSARLVQAQADSSHYTNFLKARYKATATRDTLLRQVNIIRSIDNDRFIWPHVLDEVSRALPPYTWLTGLAYTGTPQGQNDIVITPKTPPDTGKNAKSKPPKRLDTAIPEDEVTIRLLGQTVDIQALTRFMKDLEASPFFANVALDKSDLMMVSGKSVTEFQLTMAYTRPDTLLLRRAPLTLSTR